MSQELSTQTNLSVTLAGNAVVALNNQRAQLKDFIKSQLSEGSDYGIIPGVKNPSLFKPGAEKLCNIFQLGSRIQNTEKTIDFEKNFAMFEITVELFHLPTGKPISQCTGIANSQEVKFRSRSKYEWKNGARKKVGEEPTPIGDLLNTLTKMAQKRAYVGATLIATGASDFFTQDVEDMPNFIEENTPTEKKVASVVSVTPKQSAEQARQEAALNEPVGAIHADSYVTPSFENNAPLIQSSVESGLANPEYVIPIGKRLKGMMIKDVDPAELESFCNWLIKDAREKGKPLSGNAAEMVENVTAYLASLK